MAIFSRRRRDVDDRSAHGGSGSGVSANGAVLDGADDALGQIEALFAQLGSPDSGEGSNRAPAASASGDGGSVSVLQHVAYGDSRALPPFAADPVRGERAPVTDGSTVVRDEVSRGALRRSSAASASEASEKTTDGTAPAEPGATTDAVTSREAAAPAGAVAAAEAVVPADAVVPENSVVPADAVVPAVTFPATEAGGPADASPMATVAVPRDSAPTADTALERDEETGRTGTEEERAVMAHLEQAVQDLLAIDGATGVAIVDSGSGMALAQGGYPGFDLEIAAAGNSNVVRAKLQTMAQLGLSGRIDDILITLDEQYHLINVLSGDGKDGLFVYLVLDRAKANLALARHKLTGISGQLEI